MKTTTRRKPDPKDIARWIGAAKTPPAAVAVLVFFDTSDRAFFPVYMRKHSTVSHEINRMRHVNPLAEHVETLEIAY
jgi:hypothetical protein